MTEPAPGRATERADPMVPFKVQQQMARAARDAKRQGVGANPLFYPAPHALGSVIADATMQKLKRETAANLIVGHVRILQQVLGLADGELAAIVEDAARAFERVTPPVPPSGPNEPPAG